MKGDYGSFYYNASNWIKTQLAAGRRFSLAHQITANALRYPTPLAGFDIPYILGPINEDKPIPEPFKAECSDIEKAADCADSNLWFLKHDPILRRSLTKADIVISTSDFVKDQLKHCPPKRIVNHTSLAADNLAPQRILKSLAGKRLKLLHVGSIERTGGLRDLIRAIGQLTDQSGITLDVAGEGPDLMACKKECEQLGITDRITFHGQTSQEQVTSLYQDSDIFVSLSFTNTHAHSISEAMRWGLPIIAVDTGMGSNVIDRTCSFRLSAHNPQQLVSDIVKTLREVSERPFLLTTMRSGARYKLSQLGLWKTKGAWMISLYHEMLEELANNQMAREFSSLPRCG